MNPAAEARAKVKENHPEAVVVERGRNSIKHRLADASRGRKRFALDVAIGPYHYGPDNDQEIDTALVPSTAPWDWEMTKAGFEVRALSDLSAGQVIEYRSGSEWVRFQPHALQYSNDLDQIQPISMPQSVNATVDDDTLTWTGGYGPGLDFSWQVQTARLMKLLTINAPGDLPAVDQFILDGGNPVLELNLIFAHSSGVTPFVNGQEWKRGDRDTQGLVEFRDDAGNILWWFNLPRSWDVQNEVVLGTLRFKKQGNSLFVSHRVPLDFIQLPANAYPLKIDTTVDEQVGAADDNAREDDTSCRRDIAVGIGNGFGNIRQSGYRFQTVAVANSATIDVSYIELYAVGTGHTGVKSKVMGHDVDDSPDYSTCDLDTRISSVATTAKTDWDPSSWLDNIWHQSPSIVDSVQEIVDRGGWVSDQAMGILHGDDGTTSINIITSDSYDTDTTKAPKLHIEFTAAGGARRIFITHG